MRALWHWLRTQPEALVLAREERRELFQDPPVTVLAVTVAQPQDSERLFRRVARAFPELTYYDADLPLSIRHVALWDTFPLCRLELTVSAGVVQQLQVKS